MKAEEVRKNKGIIQSLNDKSKGFYEKMSLVRVLKDEKTLKKVVLEAESPNIKSGALRNRYLKDKQFIRKIFETSNDPLVSNTAKSRLV